MSLVTFIIGAVLSVCPSEGVSQHAPYKASELEHLLLLLKTSVLYLPVLKNRGISSIISSSKVYSTNSKVVLLYVCI